MKKTHFKGVIKGTFFNLITVYLSFLLGIFKTALLSRILTPDVFGYFLSSFAIMLIFQVIHWFLPPGMNNVILYHMPKLEINNNNSSKNFIVSIILIRVISICFISLSYYFSIKLIYSNNPLLFYILERFLVFLIFLELIRTFLNILVGFQKYYLYAILIIMQDSIIIIFLTFGILFYGNPNLDFVLTGFLLSYLATFITVSIILLNLLNKVSKSKIKFKFYYKFLDFSKFGFPIALMYIFDLILKDFNKILLVNFKEPFDIVLYSISQNASQLVLLATGTSSQLISAYSKIDDDASEDEVNKLFGGMMYTLGFFSLFIMLALFNFGDFYIELIYTEKYSDAILLLRIMITSGFINFLIDYISLYFKFKGMTNKLLKMKAIISLSWLISSIISIIFLSILWVVVINTLMQIFNCIFFILYIRKRQLINIELKNIFKIMIIYLISVSVIIFLDQFVFIIFLHQKFISYIILKILIYFISLAVVIILNWKMKIINREMVNNIIQLNLFPKLITRFLKKAIILLPTNYISKNKKNIDEI